jgi:hypothetical protein
VLGNKIPLWLFGFLYWYFDEGRIAEHPEWAAWCK